MEFPTQPIEQNYGNREYKRYIIHKSKKINKKTFLAKRATQLLFRIIEGGGKALYLLGIEDDGTVRGMTDIEYQKTMANFKIMVAIVGAKIKSTRTYNVGLDRSVCTIRVTT